MTAKKLDPRLENHAGGIVVVTRFQCRSMSDLLWVVLTHRRIAGDVRRQEGSAIAVGRIVKWRQRCVYSISLWRDADSIYSMGEVRSHVHGAVSPVVSRIEVVAGVFPYMGHWANLLFGASTERESPLVED